jgi:NTP pyrophosphatase (non-canonical NTP hydrolase)
MPADTVAAFAATALDRLREHFPDHASDPAQHLLKLGEEYGELTGACMRYLGRSRRSGTLEDVAAEAADVLITLHVLAASLGINLEAAWRAKAVVIAGRPWRDEMPEGSSDAT